MSRLVNLGPYELVERIAIGGMAEIYLARVSGIHDFQREFVLKLIHPKYVGDADFMRMFIDEAKLVAQLHHANIAQVFDLGHSGDNYFIVMEYVLGRDLSEVIEVGNDNECPIPVNVALGITRQLLSGLYYAHSKTDERGRSLNVVHRDITPQNLLLSFHGEVKIADFGVAKAALLARPETQAGIIKGKFKYMSPEQAWGDRLDGRSDTFSAGLLLYEMLTGSNPYEGEDVDPRQTILRMREANIPPVSHMRSGVPTEVERILARALHPNRDERYPTALDFEIAIATLLSKHDPGFSNADIAHYLRQLFPEEVDRAFIPEPTHLRFSSPLENEKTIQLGDIASDMTMPLSSSSDQTIETVDMAQIVHQAAIALKESDLIEVHEDRARSNSNQYQAVATFDPERTMSRRTQQDRQQTPIPNFSAGPAPTFTTDRPAPQIGTATLRSRIDELAERVANATGLEPQTALRLMLVAVSLFLLFFALAIVALLL